LFRLAAYHGGGSGIPDQRWDRVMAFLRIIGCQPRHRLESRPRAAVGRKTSPYVVETIIHSTYVVPGSIVLLVRCYGYPVSLKLATFGTNRG
jgi:hypothetical protein